MAPLTGTAILEHVPTAVRGLHHAARALAAAGGPPDPRPAYACLAGAHPRAGRQSAVTCTMRPGTTRVRVMHHAGAPHGQGIATPVILGMISLVLSCKHGTHAPRCERMRVLHHAGHYPHLEASKDSTLGHNA